MSELNEKASERDFRPQLLATVSLVALIGSGPITANAEETGSRPSIWIELGGQLERQTGQGNVFAPAFVTGNADSLAFSQVSPLQLEREPRYSNGLEGKLLFEPLGSEWVFSASVRYGRSTGHKDLHEGQRVEHSAH